MKNQYMYITSKEWFESSSLRNPLCVLDENIKSIYPEFFELNYDLKILVTKRPTNEEKLSYCYNDYRERYGSSDISTVETAVKESPSKNVLLNSFTQEHFEYISPLIKDTAEILYFFKCKRINDLSALSEFSNLKCVYIYGNNSLESLWDMSNNKELKVLSFVYITKLKDIEALKDSCVEYINFDTSDNFGNKKPILFD